MAGAVAVTVARAGHYVTSVTALVGMEGDVVVTEEM